MTGKELYEITLAEAKRLGGNIDLPTWDELPAEDKAGWEGAAWEQHERDLELASWHDDGGAHHD